MNVVTKISVQKKNTSRFNIFMDKGQGEEYAFAVYEETLLKFQLAKGKELDELDIEEIILSDQISKAYQSAINYLSYRMRSKKEISQHLREKEIEAFVITEILTKLDKQGYINDLAFALSYVRTQVNTTLKGPEVVVQELYEKGIEQKLIEEAILEYSFEKELDHAMKLIEKAETKYKKDSFTIKKQKIEMALKRKGYRFSTIQQAWNEMNVEKDLDEEMESLKLQAEKFKRKYSAYSGYEYVMKMKSALYRKGFSIELIDRYLEGEEE
ncbi:MULTISPECIES: recombination regulator RecX [Bacillus]|uniref:recombination regulator RecX n=1 Tax=Bacillus TaxID=1386 RepID=UPI000BB7EEC0|nr:MULTISPECIES: recombination regulator RecX [Bacillus]